MSAKDKLITYSFKAKKGTSTTPEAKRKLGNFRCFYWKLSGVPVNEHVPVDGQNMPEH